MTQRGYVGSPPPERVREAAEVVTVLVASLELNVVKFEKPFDFITPGCCWSGSFGTPPDPDAVRAKIASAKKASAKATVKVAG